MNRSHIVEILALFRLNRPERLDDLLAECSSREIAEAVARMKDEEQIEFLAHLEPDLRQHVVLALDYPAWVRLIDMAGPMAHSWAGAADRNNLSQIAHAP